MPRWIHGLALSVKFSWLLQTWMGQHSPESWSCTSVQVREVTTRCVIHQLLRCAPLGHLMIKDTGPLESIISGSFQSKSMGKKSTSQWSIWKEVFYDWTGITTLRSKGFEIQNHLCHEQLTTEKSQKKSHLKMKHSVMRRYCHQQNEWLY